MYNLSDGKVNGKDYAMYKAMNSSGNGGGSSGGGGGMGCLTMVFIGMIAFGILQWIVELFG